ncbi:MAG: hypothetical protein QXU32_08465 [Nitrososphaerales archaeon]
MSGHSYISELKLLPSSTDVRVDEPLRFDVQFRVNGHIREVLNQETWTDAYDNHDTVFLIKYMVRIQTASRKRDVVEPLKFVRKASFYWSRNPKLPPLPPDKKIWAMIVIDDAPHLPDSVEDARSLLLDVKRSVELVGSNIGKGKHKLSAYVSASWGRHLYTEPVDIEARSNEVEIVCI